MFAVTTAQGIIGVCLLLGVPVAIIAFLVFAIGNARRVQSAPEAPEKGLDGLQLLPDQALGMEPAPQQAAPAPSPVTATDPWGPPPEPEPPIYGTVFKATCWEFLRVLGIMAFLFGSVFLPAFLLWPLYPLLKGYPVPYSSTATIMQIVASAVALVVLLLGLLLARWMARKLYRRKGTGNVGRTIGLWVVVCGGSATCACQFLGLSVAILGLLFLATAIPAWIVLYFSKPFRRWSYATVFLGYVLIGTAVGAPYGYFRCLRIRAGARAKTFEGVIEQADALFEHDDFMEAIHNPTVSFGGTESPRGVLVLAAVRDGYSPQCKLSVSPLDQMIPPQMLAEDVSDLRRVVIMGPPGAEPSSRRFGLPDFRDSAKTLISPILVYRWPDKSLILKAVVRSKRRFGKQELEQPGAAVQVFPAFIEALVEVLKQLPAGHQRSRP